MPYKAFPLLAILLLISTIIAAQDMIIEGVEKAWLQSSGIIEQEGDVVGYYFFYGLKKKKGKRTYKLKIYDYELEQIAENEIIGSTRLSLEESAFDGKNLIFKFYNPLRYEFEYMIFTPQGIPIERHTRDAPGYATVSELTNSIEGYSTLFGVPGTGFVAYNRIQNKRPGYTIEKFDSQGTSLWEYISDTKSKMSQAASLFVVNERVLLSLVSKILPQRGSKEHYFIHALNMDSGEELFEVEIKNEQYAITLVNSKIDEASGDILLFGEYYPLEARQLKTPSLGLFTARMNLDGEMSDEKYISWVEDVNKFLPVDKRGKQAYKGFTWFHEVIRTADGRYFAIGEQFNHVADGLAVAGEFVGIATAILFGGGYAPSGNQMTKMVVGDMIIYEFSPEFELTHIELIPKSKFSITLPGNDSYSTRRLARQLHFFGYFDYRYTIQSEDGNSFSVGFVETNQLQNKLYFNTIKRVDDDYEKHETIIRRSATQARNQTILPAKPGYIMVSEYYNREKQIVGRLEKVKE